MIGQTISNYKIAEKIEQDRIGALPHPAVVGGLLYIFTKMELKKCHLKEDHYYEKS